MLNNFIIELKVNRAKQMTYKKQLDQIYKFGDITSDSYNYTEQLYITISAYIVSLKAIIDLLKPKAKQIDTYKRIQNG